MYVPVLGVVPQRSFYPCCSTAVFSLQPLQKFCLSLFFLVFSCVFYILTAALLLYFILFFVTFVEIKVFALLLRCFKI